MDRKIDIAILFIAMVAIVTSLFIELVSDVKAQVVYPSIVLIVMVCAVLNIIGCGSILVSICSNVKDVFSKKENNE